MLEWGPEEVGHWLETLGLAEYREHFISHDVRGQEMLSLGRTDLKVSQPHTISDRNCLKCVIDDRLLITVIRLSEVFMSEVQVHMYFVNCCPAYF